MEKEASPIRRIWEWIGHLHVVIWLYDIVSGIGVLGMISAVIVAASAAFWAFAQRWDYLPIALVFVLFLGASAWSASRIASVIDDMRRRKRDRSALRPLTNHPGAESALERSTVHRPNTLLNALTIEYIKNDKHDNVQIFPVGTRRRTIRLSLVNRGDGWISNCSLSIERTAPSIWDNVITLKSDFTLQAGEPKYIDFLYFDEQFQNGGSGEKVCVVHPGGMRVQIGFNPAESTTFTLRATADQTKEVSARFRAYVDGCHLKLETIS